MQIKKEWNNTRKSLLRLLFMSLVLVCICTLSVSKKSLAQETTDSATYAGSTSVKAYVTGSSENEQENHPEDEEHLQDESTTNAKTGDESKARGKNVILDVDTIGAMKIRALCPDATLVYILPPSWDELKSRLSSTGIYNKEEVNALMEIAEEEISCANSYDYILVNDTISNTLSRFAQIIHSNRYSRNCMKEFLDSYIDGEVKPHVQSYKEALL